MGVRSTAHALCSENMSSTLWNSASVRMYLGSMFVDMLRAPKLRAWRLFLVASADALAV